MQIVLFDLPVKICVSKIREALKAFCFCFSFQEKTETETKQDDIIMFRFCFGQVSVRLPFSHWLFRLSYPFYICLYSMIQLPGFCFVSVSFLCTLGRNLKMAGICLAILSLLVANLIILRFSKNRQALFFML